MCVRKKKLIVAMKLLMPELYYIGNHFLYTVTNFSFSLKL